MAAALAVVAATATRSVQAQVLNFTSRNGQNTVYCGPLGGPSVQNTHSTPVETHDAASVSDPGNVDMPASAATMQMDATPAPYGISLAGAGTAMRGPLQGQGFGAYATADTRDEWQFDVTVPVRFTFSAALNGASTQASAPIQAYTFGAFGGGAQVIPDPGTPPGVFGGSLIGPGSIAVSASGTLTPGRYFVELHGRVEGTNAFPYSGSYDNTLSLGLSCGTPTSYCTSGTTSNGCAARIQANGTASISATSGFTLDVVDMEGAAQGLIFYGVSGRAAAPWGTSSSFVCVKSPTQRMGVLTGSGTPGACNGAMSIDWSSYVASHPGALGVPFSAGQLVQAQGWFRDPPSPKATMLSDAVEFVVCP